uniref:Pentatricopeptide repeat-containing protein n=1 Tax=Palpitomonas bilix TaxID=652834 RepID=A0A7S3D916_9EUKA
MAQNMMAMGKKEELKQHVSQSLQVFPDDIDLQRMAVEVFGEGQGAARAESTAFALHEMGVTSLHYFDLAIRAYAATGRVAYAYQLLHHAYQKGLIPSSTKAFGRCVEAIMRACGERGHPRLALRVFDMWNHTSAQPKPSPLPLYEALANCGAMETMHAILTESKKLMSAEEDVLVRRLQVKAKHRSHLLPHLRTPVYLIKQ